MFGALLLKSGRGKGHRRFSCPLALLNIADPVIRPLQLRHDPVNLFLRGNLSLLKISIVFCHQRLLYPFYGELCLQRPIFTGDKGVDLRLAVRNNPKRYGLYAARAQASLNLLPEQRTDGISHHAVQYTPRLLGVHKIHINLSGLFDGLLHGIFRNLIKSDPAGLPGIQLQSLAQMPGYRLPLPVRVCRKIDPVSLFHFLPEPCQKLTLSSDGNIMGFKIIVKIDSHLALRHIPDMSVGCHHFIIFPQKLLYRL